MDERTDTKTDRQVDERADGQRRTRTDRQVDERADGETEKQTPTDTDVDREKDRQTETGETKAYRIRKTDSLSSQTEQYTKRFHSPYLTCSTCKDLSRQR